LRKFISELEEGGSFGDVDATRGADEVGQHMPQYAYEKMVGTSRNDGPALLMSKEDHASTRSFAGRGKILKLCLNFRNK